MQVRVKLGKLIQWTGVLVGLGLLALGLAYAGPARAMGVPGRGPVSPATARPNTAPTGAAAIFGLDGSELGWDPNAQLLGIATGARWTRVEVSWANIEPVQGEYHFEGTDSTLGSLVAAGLSPVVYIADNPSWAAKKKCGPVNTKDPTKVAAFQNIIGMLADRYQDIKVWALYNEIDNTNTDHAGCFGSFTKGGVNKNKIPDYQEYAIMLAAAWQAVHDNSPNAQLAVGALAYDNFHPQACPPNYPGPGSCIGGSFNYNFVPNLFKYMKDKTLQGKYMDLVLFNYYNIYGRYWEKVSSGKGIQAKASALRGQMAKAGIKVVNLLVTETGEDSGDWWIGLKGQARCLDITMVRGAAAKLKGVIWWTFKDNPGKPDPSVWKYGIVDQNMQPKPSYAALQTLANELNGFKYKKNYSGQPGFTDIEAYNFVGQGAKKYAVWSSSIKASSDKPDCSWSRNKRLVTFSANSLSVVNYLGGPPAFIADNSKKDKDKTAGKIAIPLTGDPKIVQINPPNP